MKILFLSTGFDCHINFNEATLLDNYCSVYGKTYKCSNVPHRAATAIFPSRPRPEMRDGWVVFWHQMETLRSFVWPLTLQNLNEIQNQIQCFAGNTFKVTHLHLPLQKCCSWEFWSWNGFVCYNSFLISDSRESLDQACLAEENIVSKYFSMKICHKFPKCVFNVKQSF